MFTYHRQADDLKDQSLIHFSYYRPKEGSFVSPNENAGDTALHDATRRLFDHFLGPNRWLIELLWQPVTTDTIAKVNQTQAAILGGGGLLLRDQKGAEKVATGWQWNCSLEQLVKFQVPLLVFAIGYNRFRGQDDFSPIFTKHINSVIEQSAFFGLRNSGSIRALTPYLTPANAKKLSLQPCPTTLAWYLYPEIHSGATVAHDKTMAVNIALDRTEYRFGSSQDQILNVIAKVLSKYQQQGWSITLANHKPEDAAFAKFLKHRHLPYTAVNLWESPAQDVFRFYQSQAVSVGMRGHAQMIPFGLRKRIVSIISHDKMQWFLEDIGHPEWGADVRDRGFADQLDHAIATATSEHQAANLNKSVIESQEKLWQLTDNNLSKIQTLVASTMTKPVSQRG